MRFTKMQGLGNDYLYVYGEVPENIAELSRKLSDRHFGAGSDGMIYISPSDIADFRMRMFNADGSEGKMCGNGIRCVGKYVYDKGYTDKTCLRIETLSGIKTLKMQLRCGKVSGVTVGMGPAEVGDEMEITAGDSKVTGTPVSVGNPHFVIFVDDLEKAPLYSLGPVIEKHESFPEGVNVEFVQVVGRDELRMRVWERGSGVTMACGTGACASAAAAVKKGFCSPHAPVTVALDGGDLEISITGDGEAIMTGPAVTVYEGEVII
ncbi:MAG: diaminopimelate epimerase [Oscillospiraceae bacterium]|nr:diaminopimelate epimerase [Oscillospiraceae bacterium]